MVTTHQIRHIQCYRNYLKCLNWAWIGPIGRSSGLNCSRNCTSQGTMYVVGVSAPFLEDDMTTRSPDAEPLLTPAEVAALFRVDPKTVTRWAKAGKLSSIRTLGGHRRYRESEVRALLAAFPQQRVDKD